MVSPAGTVIPSTQNYGAKLDAERQRKRDVIVQMIFDEASQGRVYTSNQFAESFEGQAGLGANRTINERIAVHATKGDIKFFRNPEDYKLVQIADCKRPCPRPCYDHDSWLVSSWYTQTSGFSRKRLSIEAYQWCSAWIWVQQLDGLFIPIKV
jgi:hypothetical protein